MNSTFKKVALASALMATSALVAPALANPVTLQAVGPVSGSTGKAYATKDAKVSFTLHSAAAAVNAGFGTGGKVFYYDATGLINAGGTAITLTAVRTGGVSGDALRYEATLPNTVSGRAWTHVAFLVSDADTRGATDDFAGAGAGQNNAWINPDKTLTLTTLADGTDVAAANKWARTDGYYGPALTAATISSDQTKLFLKFDTNVQDADATVAQTGISTTSTAAITSDVLLYKGNQTTPSAQAALVVATTQLDDKSILTMCNEVGCTTPLNSDLVGGYVHLKDSSAIVDTAKNAAVVNASKTVVAEATKPVADTSVSKNGIVSSVTGTLWDGSATAVDVSLRYSQPMADLGGVANVKVYEAGTTTELADSGADKPTIAARASSGNNVVVRLTADATGDGDGKFGVDPATGKIVFDKDGNWATTTDQKAIDVLISKTGANPATSVYGGAQDAADQTFAAVVVGEAPAAGALQTADSRKADGSAGADGKLDGFKIDFKTPVTVTGTGGFAMTVNGSAANNAITVAGASAVNTGDTSAVVTAYFDQAGKFDWDKDGVIAGAAEEAQDAAVYAAFTTADTAKYSASLAAADSTVVYSRVWDAATGANLKASLGATSVAADGVGPLVTGVTFYPVEGTSPAAGYLKITTSEAIASVAGATADQFNFAGSPLSLLNLNAGITAAPAFAIDPDDNKSILIGTAAAPRVSADVVGKALTVTSGVSVVDGSAAQNKITADGSKSPTGGTTQFTAPTIAQAVAARSAGSPDGNVDQVIVKFSKPVALETGGQMVDGLFSLDIDYDGNVGNGYGYSVTIPASGITVAADGYVTLAVPTPGLKGTLTALRVNYNANGTLDNAAAGKNRLMSTDAPAVVVATTENKDVTFAKNSTKLYTMEVKGTLTTDGTAVAPKGTIVRADLVDFASALTMKGAVVNVPCNCTGAAGVAVPAAGAIATLIDNDRKLGKASSKAFVVATLSANQDTVSGVAMAAAHPGANNTTRVYEVAIDTKTGAVTGSGVTGSVQLSETPALTVLDTVYQVTNDGKFRFAIGSNTAPKNAFVLASVKRPDGDMFTAITSPVTSFANHVPFASNVTASGIIGGDLGTVNLSKIYDTAVRPGDNWQLVGLKGEIARTTDVKRKAEGVSLDRLLISVKGDSGAPVTAWAFDGDDDDEGFLLLNNATKSALQIDATTIDNVKDVNGGIALALKNGGNYTQVGGGNTAIDTTLANSFNVFYPISGHSSEYKAEAAKWSLLTMENAVADIATWANTNKVGAIIVVGSGNYQKAWFKGATDNTLTSLANGDRAFVYFEGANAAYKYGR